MTKQIEQLTSEKAKELLERRVIDYETSVILDGPGWVNTPEEYRLTVMTVTDADILVKSDFYEITNHENGIQIMPYEQAKGGAIKVHSFFVNFYRNVKQNTEGVRK